MSHTTLEREREREMGNYEKQTSSKTPHLSNLEVLKE
jgi:hypothetical protein